MTLDTGNPPSAAARGGRQLADGLTITRLGYGAMQLPGPGIWGPPPDRDAAIAVLRRAVDLGVTHIDTSHAYGPQVANELIRDGKLHQVYSQMQLGQGVHEMQTFNQSLADLVQRNLVSNDIALKRSSDPDELRTMLERGTGLGGRRR